MRSMEPQEDTRIVDRPATVADRASKSELEAQHKIVELLRSIVEDGMICNCSLYAFIADESWLAWLSDQHTIDQRKASGAS